MKEADQIQELYEKLRSGDRVALGRAITLVESKQPSHRAAATLLLDNCLAESSGTFRFAISGAPGVGKSTFIEALGNVILEDGGKLAVLAIDPSSTIGGGSILGDKTRMPSLATHPNAFVRPSAAGGTLGGVADRTREVISLCEAAGYDNICVETVGVGQSEVEAHGMTDLFVLLVAPGGGDDLQGIKKGVVELADVIIINKSDNDQVKLARQTQQFYRQALRLLAPKSHGLQVEVEMCSAITGDGIREAWELLVRKKEQLKSSGFFETKRIEQDRKWLERNIGSLLRMTLMQNDILKTTYDALIKEISNRNKSVSSAVIEFEALLKKILES